MSQLFSREAPTPPAATAKIDEPESTVLANTANRTTTAEESPLAAVTEPPVSTEILPLDATEGGSATLTVPPATATEVRPERERSGPKIWDRRAMSAAAESTVHRLKRALSADSDADVVNVDPITRQDPVRVRVDGLVHEAEDLLEAGDLQDAKVLAERAVELAATVTLDYLPTEERPDDLLQKIVTAIDERDRAPSIGGDTPTLPVLTVPRENLPLNVGDESLAPPLESATVITQDEPSPMSLVAANRPGLLSVPLTPSRESDSPSSLVVMDRIADEGIETPLAIDPVTAVGLAAPSATGARLRMNRDAGPLLVAAENRPVPPQVAEVSPLPAYTATAAPRPESLATDAPTFTFVWADLWPLWGLAVVVGIVSLMLLIRRCIAGH